MFNNVYVLEGLINKRIYLYFFDINKKIALIIKLARNETNNEIRINGKNNPPSLK